MADQARNAAGLGKSATLTVLTPIRPGWRWLLKIILWVLDHLRERSVEARQLAFLSFVHWVVVPKDRIPRLDTSQPKENLNYDYLFFLSNFSGPWGPYIDAFADVLGYVLDTVWSCTIKYPGARPVTGLKAHIMWNRVESDHHYSAYPGASIRDVRAAFLVSKALTELAEIAPGVTAEQFGDAYNRTLLDIQNRLSDIGAGT